MPDVRESLATLAKLCRIAHKMLRDGELVGPPGFEPGTKGFACSESFLSARTISSPSDVSQRAGGVRDARACYEGR